MPARNGKGPSGLGPRTGRGLGNCSSDKIPNQGVTPGAILQPLGWGRRLWRSAWNGLFRFGRGKGNLRR